MPGTSAITWTGAAQPLAGTDRRVAELLDVVWRTWFADVPRVNVVAAGYDYPWKRHLGRIRMTLDGEVSAIGLNRRLDDPAVPDAVRIAILSHEIVHYAHGFGSPLPRRQQQAHAHGAVGGDLAARGLRDYVEYLDGWVTAHWAAMLARNAARRRTPAYATCAPAQRVV